VEVHNIDGHLSSTLGANDRKLLDCGGGFNLNACANCCGYKFPNDGSIYDAVLGYSADNLEFGEMRCWDVSSVTDVLFIRSFPIK
jgi:hypothetical protein